MRLLRLVFVSAVALAIGIVADHIAAAAQSTFSSANRTVAIYATVTNADGRLMPDLLSGDFEVYDNGKRQPITIFGNEVQPITAVMLLDRSVSMLANFHIVEKAAETFVNAMLPNDKARIGSFSVRIQVDPQDFTSDHDELLRILRNELQDAGPTPLWNAINVGITALSHQEGRRVILVFTDGRDAPNNGGNNNSSLNDVMKRAEEENVMVYAIGLASRSGGQRGGYERRGGGGGYGGRRGGFPGGAVISGPAFQRRGGFGGSGRRSNQGGAADKPEDPGLAKIAAATGGGYFELTSTDNLATTFSQVADELHHQYTIGFTPPRLDGKRHTLDVRVLLSGTTARARKSYVAAKQ